MNLRIIFFFCKNDLPILLLPLDECAEILNNYVNACRQLKLSEPGEITYMAMMLSTRGKNGMIYTELGSVYAQEKTGE